MFQVLQTGTGIFIYSELELEYSSFMVWFNHVSDPFMCHGVYIVVSQSAHNPVVQVCRVLLVKIRARRVCSGQTVCGAGKRN